MTTVKIIGVHPIVAAEPVHLVVADVDGELSDEALLDITQPIVGQPRSNWQVPFDERLLHQNPQGGKRIAFFFHYLDLTQPLLTSLGPVPIPPATPTPDYLKAIRYDAP